MSDKTYINGLFIKEFIFNNGGSVLNISINVDKFKEELDKYRDSKGYAKIKILERREADKNGNTHYAELNTYEKPNQTQDTQDTQSNATAIDNIDIPDEDDSLPF